MSRIEIKSFVKINLSIDVGAACENGYHSVDMVMQQLSFHDDVTVEYMPPAPESEEALGAASENGGSFDIEVRTNRYYLPVDRRNLAYQAAELMAGIAEDVRPDVLPGKILIGIKKRIPVAGGLAGGSGNAAAVLHALNILWDLDLSLEELMDLGAKLGSDVPFCVMGQAKANSNIPEHIRNDRMAVCAARATGRGTELTPVVPLKAWMVIAKPHFSVSTKEVYQGIDKVEITERPDNDRLVKKMQESASSGKADYAVPDDSMYRDFINVLEEYTLRAYPEVGKLKQDMKGQGASFALMSGSGPTVFGIFSSMKEAERAALRLQDSGCEAYWTRTTV